MQPRPAATIAVTVLRISGVVQLLLGLLFWSGNMLSLIPLHMRNGFLVVISLWVLALLAARGGVGSGAVLLAIVWGLIVPIVGLTQTRMLPGSYHGVVQVVHLLLGVGAITLGERLFAGIRGDATVMG